MNSRQLRLHRRLIQRKLDHFAHVLAVNIRPMIKDEWIKEFDEITQGILEAKEDVRTSRRHPVERDWGCE